MSSTVADRSLLPALGILYKWRKLILLLVFAVGVLGAGTSLLLKNYYTSTAVFYPANPALSDVSRLFGTRDNQFSYFGSDDQIDQALILGNSNRLADFLIDSFDLYEVYRVNPKKAAGQKNVRLAFFKHFSLTKNENGALVISVEDREPTRAAAMVQAVLFFLDKELNNLSQPNKAKTLQLFENALQTKEKRQKIVADSLDLLRRQYNIYDVGNQTALITAELIETETKLVENKGRLRSFTENNAPLDTLRKYKAVVRGLEDKAQAFTNPDSSSIINLIRFNNGREAVRSFEYELESLLAETNELRRRYSQYTAAYTTQLVSLYIVEAPQVPRVKSRPRRSILVLSTLVIAFVLSCTGVLLFERSKDIDWKAVTRPQ